MQALACQLPAAKALPVYWTVTINHGELDLKGSTDELDQVPQDIQTGLSARTHANIYTWVCTSVCVCAHMQIRVHSRCANGNNRDFSLAECSCKRKPTSNET